MFIFGLLSSPSSRFEQVYRGTGAALYIYRPGTAGEPRLLTEMISSGYGAYDLSELEVTVGTFSVGGEVTGLTGTVVLQNGAVNPDYLSVSENGAYAFHELLSDSDEYGVAVYSQPENQECTADNGSGIIEGGDVTDVFVTCREQCPDDPDKDAPGICGCGVPDTDGDGDGTPDCNDTCRADAGKVDPGVCGCGVADEDGDANGIMDCLEGCEDVSGVWILMVTDVTSSCGQESGWSSEVTISQTECSLQTTGIKETTFVVSGNVDGNVVTIGPGNFQEGAGITTATYTMTLDPDGTMSGNESWTWGDNACDSGTASLTAAKN